MKNLWLVLPDVNDAGSLSTWGFHALDAKYWFLLLSILKHLSNQTLDNPLDGKEADGDETQPDPYPPSTSPTCQAPPTQPPNSPTGTRSTPHLTSRNNGTSRGLEGFGGPHSPHPPPPPSPPVQSPPRNYFPPSPPPHSSSNYNERGVGINIQDSLGVLGLEMGVTVREVNVRYRFLARRLHPNKHDTEVTGMTSEEAVEMFKLVNKAQQYLRENIMR